MALKTMGTNTTTQHPSSIQWQPGGLASADMAALRAAIKFDTVAAPIAPAAIENGRLFLPRSRGVIILYPGDWISVGTTGWPIVISNGAVTADWTHS